MDRNLCTGWGLRSSYKHGGDWSPATGWSGPGKGRFPWRSSTSSPSPCPWGIWGSCSSQRSGKAKPRLGCCWWWSWCTGWSSRPSKRCTRSSPGHSQGRPRRPGKRWVVLEVEQRARPFSSFLEGDSIKLRDSFRRWMVRSRGCSVGRMRL